MHYDVTVPKKAVNVSLNSDLLARARGCRINLSAVLERALASEVARCEREAWAQENAPAIEAYNACVEEVGVFGDTERSF